MGDESNKISIAIGQDYGLATLLQHFILFLNVLFCVDISNCMQVHFSCIITFMYLTKLIISPVRIT